MCYRTKSFSAVKTLFRIFNIIGCIPLKCDEKSSLLKFRPFSEITKFLGFLLTSNSMIIYGWFAIHSSPEEGDKFVVENMSKITGHSKMDIAVGHLYAGFSNLVAVGLFIASAKSRDKIQNLFHRFDDCLQVIIGGSAFKFLKKIQFQV